MCFGGKVSTPSIAPTPTPSPTPTITPSEVSPQVADQARKKQIERLRSGFVGTIKTTMPGLLESQSQKKKKLGE